jgi:hypothetical protein
MIAVGVSSRNAPGLSEAIRSMPRSLRSRQPVSCPASDFVAGLNTLTMQVTATDFVAEGARLRGWLVGAGSAVSDPTFHSETWYDHGKRFQWQAKAGKWRAKARFGVRSGLVVRAWRHFGLLLLDQRSDLLRAAATPR